MWVWSTPRVRRAAFPPWWGLALGDGVGPCSCLPLVPGTCGVLGCCGGSGGGGTRWHWGILPAGERGLITPGG